MVSYHNHFGGESIGNYLWLCETVLDARAETGAQLLGSCANWLLWRGSSRPQYVGDAPWRSPTYRPPVAPELIDQIGSGSLHRLGERAIDDEVGSRAPAARLEMDTTRAANFSGMPIRPVGFKAIADQSALSFRWRAGSTPKMPS